MTKCERTYELARPLDAALLEQISALHAVVGIQKLRPSAQLDAITVGWDAARLSIPQAGKFAGAARLGLKALRTATPAREAGTPAGRCMKIALAQFNPTIGALAANVDRMAAMAREAAGRGADIVAFPELAICGYPPRDLLEKPSFVEGCAREMARLARPNGRPASRDHRRHRVARLQCRRIR